MKLGLGTVQFGLDYGIANQTGKCPESEARRILEYSSKKEIKYIDTAAQYGSSEELLGRILPLHHDFRIITKTPSFKVDRITDKHAHQLEETFNESLNKLGQKSVYGLLLHNSKDLLADNSELLIDRMLDLKARKLVNKIGVSAYTADQLDCAIGRFPIDIAQIPINIFDQRLIQSGHLVSMKEKGIELHARSVFLQGLLLMTPDSIPEYLAAAREQLRKFHESATSYGVTLIEAALGFCEDASEIDVVVCGVDSLEQWREIYTSQGKPLPHHVYAGLAISDEKILNPARWHV